MLWIRDENGDLVNLAQCSDIVLRGLGRPDGTSQVIAITAGTGASSVLLEDVPTECAGYLMRLHLELVQRDVALMPGGLGPEETN